MKISATIAMVALLVIPVTRWLRVSYLGVFSSWQHGDWLINFAGGPTRRGAIGELFAGSGLSGNNLLVALALFQAVVLTILFVLVLLLVRSVGYSYQALALTLSPGFLFFATNDVGAGFRKEILGLAILAAVAVGFTQHRATRVAGLLLPLFLLAALSHELNALFAIPLIILVNREDTIWVGRGFKSLVNWTYGGLAIAAILFAVLYQGVDAIDPICSSWRRNGLEDCGGALSALSRNPSYYFDLLATEHLPNYLLYFFPIAFLSVLIYHSGIVRFEPALIIFPVSILPLFIIGLDWGRWIYIVYGSFVIVLLALQNRGFLAISTSRVWLFVIPINLFWSLSHGGSEPIRFGFFPRLIFSIFRFG